MGHPGGRPYQRPVCPDAVSQEADLPVKKRDTVCQVLSGGSVSSHWTSSREPYKGWILEIYDRLEHKNRGTLADIWEDTVREYLGASGLPDEELDKLINLGGQLGVADIEMQVKTLDLYLEEMSLSMEEMRGGMKAKVRLCHCLGVMSGIFITVLLI